MSISTQIERIRADKVKIRNKLVSFGLASNTDNLDTLANAVDGIEKKVVDVEIKEGNSYAIPKGYHDGSGVVKAITDVEGEANKYKTQTKVVTPEKGKTVMATPDTGFYALSSVAVNPIPDNYADISDVTAEAENVLSGKVFVDSEGTVTTGTMKNNGKVQKQLNFGEKAYTIPAGYHNGEGMVRIVTEAERTVTPTEEEQTIAPTDNSMLLSTVKVNPIPAEYTEIYHNRQSIEATPDKVLDGVTFMDSDGNLQEGAMPINEGTPKLISVDNPEYTIPEGYHSGIGMVLIAPEEQTKTPSKAKQEVTPSSGKVLSKVTINPIPDNFADTTDATANATHIIEGKTAYIGADGKAVKVTGTIKDYGQGKTFTVDGLNTTSVPIPEGFYAGEQTVANFDDTAIVNALAAI